MGHCPVCSRELPGGVESCPEHAAAVSSETATREAPHATPPKPPVRERSQGRFVPGTLLGARYRVVALLGSGGMGEVYRAEDLRLGQTVAIKFLPPGVAGDPVRLARFRDEVRLAREVTHPNVCRVHDLGEAEGLTFLSMEFVDGEDLASLLRRIGRLPPDKGLDIARQLCAGLAAAHARGIIHRDLKPANVMLDGRGRVRIMDFGLARFTHAIERGDVASGTPAYMAPEQALGREVSVQSDLYAVGLVLYELFAGRPAFLATTREAMLRAQLESTPRPPAQLVPGLEPGVERVILQCLKADPRERPASATAVAASLPGGDPLAAALAAGETPSPEMVAAAGEEGSLPPAVAFSWLVAAAAGLALLFGLYLHGRPTLVQWVPMSLAPDVLADRAQQTLRRLGFEAAPKDRAWGFSYDERVVRELGRGPAGAALREELGQGRPAAIYFWYRESPALLVARGRSGMVRERDPPPLRSGMLEVKTDTQGRLIGLRATPPLAKQGHDEPAASIWPRLFAEADLDPQGFRETSARHVPPVFADTRAAWDGPFGRGSNVAVHVEAATLTGVPVFFQIEGPWTVEQEPGGTGFGGIAIVSALVLLAGAVLARHNLRRGRGDVRGARRLAAFVFALSIASWLLEASHVGVPLAEWQLLARGLAWALFDGVTLWLYYLALEPYVRRFWPETIVSWSRLLAGRVRDPLVGRDVLIGLSVCFWIAGPANYLLVLPEAEGGARRVMAATSLDALLGPGHLVANILGAVGFALQFAFLYLVLLLVLRVVLRRTWLVVLVFVAATVVSGLGILATWFGASRPVDALMLVATAAMIVGLLTRVGLLAVVASMLPMGLYLNVPAIGAEPSAWYAPSFYASLAVLLAVVAYAFRLALGPRRLWTEAAIDG
jgi:serine/threonine-protein kinase